MTLENLIELAPVANWRVGGKVPLNIYEGDTPMFQCHTPEHAARVVKLLNAAPDLLAIVAAAQAVIYGCHKCSGYLDGRLPQCPEHNALRAALAKLEGKGL